MRHLLKVLSVLFSVFVLVSSVQANDYGVPTGTDRSKLRLWYDTPATQWTAALPLGNGRMGVMVFGDAKRARYQFNEDSLWSGGPRSYAHPGAAEYLPQIRSLLFAGKQHEAEQLANEHFMSIPLRQMSYQPFGDILLDFAGRDKPEEYRRWLDLDTAIAISQYRIDGVTFTREIFASFSDQALVIHLTCDKPAGMTFTATLSSPQTDIQVSALDPDTLLMTGRVRDAEIKLVGVVESKMQLAANLHILHTDGRISAEDGVVRVEDASNATLVLTAATNYVDYQDLSADPVSRSKEDLHHLLGRTYEELRAAHVADHQQLFSRVSLDLGDLPEEDLPTDQRVLRHGQRPDPALEALLFQYGRYLMIASSRPGSQPANLQGVWNDQLRPPWESKYTVNINTEMNYWLTEPCNLSECNEPLFRALAEVAQSGQKTAQAHYDARGWVLHHNFDLWRGTAPINASDHGIWPSGGAWLCQHLWWHYLYSGDEEFLRETAYPLMKGASEFFADYLVEDPRSVQKWLVSGPSNSPEQGGLVMGPTMDHQIIRELFSNTIEAAEQLEVDQDFRDELSMLQQRIAPNQIGQYGQLQEWLEDKDNPDNKHRHVSHLWGLFPGDEISLETPDLLNAAKTSLEFRGDGGTGWSLGWKTNLWARLRDGDHAYRLLQGLLKLTDSPLTEHHGSGVYTNLFDAHPPFQIDGNFGATNGICQMLLQSQRKTDDGLWLIELLPALPTAWPEGSVTGLRARGGFDVDIAWKDGQLTEVSLHSSQGGTCQLSYGDRQVKLSLAPGETESLGATLGQ